MNGKIQEKDLWDDNKMAKESAPIARETSLKIQPCSVQSKNSRLDCQPPQGDGALRGEDKG